jgi:hypothetical protein
VQYVRTLGRRGSAQLSSVNWLMLEAARAAVRFRVMASGEPLTIPSPGYPVLLQEAYLDRGNTITDRVQAHHWLTEVAALYNRAVTANVDLSVYAAPIGEPALGPVAYTHRPSARFDPLAPLGHHRQDGAHARFGVLTLGLHSRRLLVEGSAFNDRQPSVADVVFYYRDARLDSFAGRVTWNPSAAWSLSASYGYLSPSAGGHAHDARHRFGVVAIFTSGAHDSPAWSVTLSCGADDPLGPDQPLPTCLAEGTRAWGERQAAFARVEYVRRTAAELALVGSVPPELDVGAASLGYSRQIATRFGWALRAAARGSVSLIPNDLVPFYGSRMPLGLQAYLHVAR